MKNSFKQAIVLAAVFATAASAQADGSANSLMAEAQKAYVSGNWKKAATSFEQACPKQPADSRTECYLWNVLALSQTGNANDFAKAGKRLDSLIEKTNPQKKVYADLMMTRAQFQLYLGKYENAANALVHAIETSKPEHAPVLQKVCTAVQAKIKQDNLTEACSNLGKEQPAKTAATQEPAPKQAAAPANTASKAAPTVIDLPDFDSDETAKKSAPASAVQPQQTESWTLQLGAFSMKSNADALVENLKKRKIPCNIVEQAQDSRTLYVVQSGDFVSKEKAIDYGARELSPLNVDFRATLKK
ncbi:MAG: SPOR domain-containing protein [Fibrobacter sp.]|uniref:SPOR domain-containing protein n=1 Tax=Fibrobacter sp. TaxID=35828 RepID=UPI001AFE4DBB|nr:SPOR domain-containing protein [Fibrobacter sp.]MBO7062081.1 SPOR domain-containing protein [Fibrobacter sp.]